MVRITRVLLGVLVFTLPFDQAFAVPFVGSLSRAVGLLVAASGILTLMSGRLIRLRKPNLFLLCAGAFVAWNVLSTVWAIDRASTVTQAFTYVQLWVLTLLLWQFVESSAQASRLRHAYMLGTWVTIGTVVWAYLSHNPTIDPTRFTAFDTNANYTAQSIAIAVPMAFDAAVHGRRWPPRLLALALIPASLFGIALTGSRSGGIIATLVVVGSVVLIMRNKPIRKVLMLTGLVLVAVLLAITLPSTTIQRFEGIMSQVRSADFSGRGEIWQAGFEAWLFHPAIGAGSGNFGEAVVPTLGYSRPAHNSFLGLLVELGPVGPTLFLLLFLIALWPHLVTLLRRDGTLSAEARRYAALHVMLFVALLVAQLPTNWQYQRITWYVLTAATLDGAVFLRAVRPLGTVATTRQA